MTVTVTSLFCIQSTTHPLTSKVAHKGSEFQRLCAGVLLTHTLGVQLQREHHAGVNLTASTAVVDKPARQDGDGRCLLISITTARTLGLSWREWEGGEGSREQGSRGEGGEGGERSREEGRRGEGEWEERGGKVG